MTQYHWSTEIWRAGNYSSSSDEDFAIGPSNILDGTIAIVRMGAAVVTLQSHADSYSRYCLLSLFSDH
jgi:hypothetical protein